MKTLIITEKPSVAQDFAKALNVRARKDGYFENEKILITWAIGHLLTPCYPEDYDPKFKRWKLETLPIIPKKVKYKAVAGTKKQLEIIKTIFKNHPLKQIIVATDAGREGELIARTLLEHVKADVNSYRFWTSQALTPDVIIDTLKEKKPLKEYDRLFLAGKARQHADWLVGMNLTRLASLKLGDLFSVGRVQTAVLALLVAKRREIDSFKPDTYFTVHGNFLFNTINGEEILDATWFDHDKKKDNQKITKEEIAKNIVTDCKHGDVLVKEVLRETKETPPPQLFSLTELQKSANKLFSMSAIETLNTAQALYEKHKCLSYPRTDSRVLGSKSFPLVKGLVANFKASYPEHFKNFSPEKMNLKNRLVFNDSKLTDHHALIPMKPFKGDPNSNEGKIYDLVLKRFVAIFCRNYKYEECKITTTVKDHHFRSSGNTVIDHGWKILSGTDKDKLLPNLIENDKGTVKKISKKKKETKPPSEYTEATLLQDMINPSRLVTEKEHKRVFRGDVGLGTQATRAQIIETLLDRKYVKRLKKNLIVQDKGIILISTFETMQVSSTITRPEQTAKWELKLEEMAQGDGDFQNFMNEIESFTTMAIEEWRTKEIPKVFTSQSPKNTKPSLGKCPICQADVVESPKAYGCCKWREGCKFTIWKTIASKPISLAQAKKIITNGQSDKLKGFKSRTGKTFDATLVLKNNIIELSFQ